LKALAVNGAGHTADVDRMLAELGSTLAGSVPKGDQLPRNGPQLSLRNVLLTKFEVTSDTDPRQELSYCKQIVRQLRAQYDSPMTLKSRLSVTQAH